MVCGAKLRGGIMTRPVSAAMAAVVLGVSMMAAGPAEAWDRQHHHPPPSYHHHDRGGDVALGVGLGILGLGLTAAMLSPPAYYAPPAPPPVYYTPPPPPVYYAPPLPPPAYYAPRPMVVVPSPMSAAPASDSYIADDGRTCREYQTTVVVGGRRQAAYGTACLVADGTWRVVR
jgi:hypothetical protein